MSTIKKLEHWMRVFAPSAEGEDGFLCAHIEVALVKEALRELRRIEELEKKLEEAEYSA